MTRKPTNVVKFQRQPKLTVGPVVTVAPRLSDQLEPIANQAREKIEELFPLTTSQRMRLVLIFEDMLDEFDRPPQPGGVA
jgi:hypothetical protein